MAARSALHHHNSSWLPYKYDINVYRGCSHRCIYCYALYSHEYIGGGDFYGDIYAKTNVADVLARELVRHGGQMVNLGGVCDSYQHAEREYRLMPQVLKLLAKHKVPTVVCTKSPLILRDIDLLEAVDKANALGTAFTITTMDAAVARLIEPDAPGPGERMDAVSKLRARGLACGVHMMPIIPFLTSEMSSLEAVFRAAKDAGAEYVLAGALNLKGRTRPGFMDSVRLAFPSEYRKVREIYRSKQAYRAYKEHLHETLETLRKKYDMPFYRELDVRKDTEQLSFL